MKDGRKGRASIHKLFVEVEKNAERVDVTVGRDIEGGIRSITANQAFDTDELYDIVGKYMDPSERDRIWAILAWVWETRGSDKGTESVVGIASAAAYLQACKSISHDIKPLGAQDAEAIFRGAIFMGADIDPSKERYPHKNKKEVSLLFEWTGTVAGALALRSMQLAQSL